MREPEAPTSPAAEPRAADALAAQVASAIEGLPETAWDRRGYVLRRVLAVGDLAALGGAFLVIVSIQSLLERPLWTGTDLAIFLGSLPIWFLLAYLTGLYHESERRIDHSTADDVAPVFHTTTVWAWTLLLALAVLRSGPNEVFPVALLWIVAIVLLIAVRALSRWSSRRRPWFRQQVLLVGRSDDVERVAARLRRHREFGLDIVGDLRLGVPGAPLNGGGEPAAESRLIDLDEAETLSARVIATVEQAGVGRVIIAGWPDLGGRTELLRALVAGGVHVDLVSGEPEALVSSGILHHVEGLPMLAVSPPRLTRTSLFLKRVVDLALSAALLAIMLPFLGFIAIRIKAGSRGPILFRQHRVGLMGRPFDVLKFRTMEADADQRKDEVAALNMHGNGDDASMFKVPGDPRVTRCGAWLRRWSLDELPQLWNVLRGQMSLVGPRPLIPEEAGLVEGHYLARLAMRPGMTGPWQTQGRSDIPFEDMLKLDYTYAMTWTLREDARIMLRTMSAVVRARGAY